MYSVCLDIEGRLCVVIGGGKVAQRKVRNLLRQGGRVRLVSPDLTKELWGLVRNGDVEWRKKKYERDDIHGAFLIFAATGDRKTQQRIQEDADASGVLVNVIDDPISSSFHVPATFARGDIEIAVSTKGKSPALAARVKQRLKDCIGREYGVHLDILSRLRKQVLNECEEEKRAAVFREMAGPEITFLIQSGQWDQVEAHIKQILGDSPEIDWAVYKQDNS